MRCFIGVPVADELAKRLRGLALPADGRAVLGRDLHLTLAFLGEIDESRARRLWERLGKTLSKLPAFTAPITGVGPFPRSGGRIWAASVAPVAALQDLHQAVWRVLDAGGIERDRRRYRPHLTLARTAMPIAAPARALAETLPVTQVVFYQSPGGEMGYRRLAVWPLG